MLEILDLFLIYCAASSPACVEMRPSFDRPLTRFSQCEQAGRTGDRQFQAAHPEWHLRAFTCALRKPAQLPA